MDWIKMKKNLIVIFVAVNAFLLVFNYYVEKNRYTLSPEDKMVLNDIFKENRVSNYTVLPNFYPMPQLKLREGSFNKVKLVKKVTGEDVDISYAEANFTYTNDKTGDSITFTDSENKLIFEAKEGVLGNPTSFAEARNIANQFVTWLLDDDYKLEKTREIFKRDEEEYTFYFNEIYKGYKVFSNTLKVTMNKTGVVSAEFVRLVPMLLDKVKWEITPVDDVIYNVLNYIKNTSPNSNVHIRSVETGYRVDYTLMGNERTANPYYYVYYVISGYDGNAVENKVLYIDAYDNEFIPEN